jgi:hypothetical protein
VCISLNGKNFRFTRQFVRDFNITFQPFDLLVDVILNMDERGTDRLSIPDYSRPRNGNTIKAVSIDIGETDKEGYRVMTLTRSED